MEQTTENNLRISKEHVAIGNHVFAVYYRPVPVGAGILREIQRRERRQCYDPGTQPDQKSKAVGHGSSGSARGGRRLPPILLIVIYTPESAAASARTK